jgi:hypothetical protein
MSNKSDIEAFNSVLDSLAEDFRHNPFEYGNEDMIGPELYRRLHATLNDVRVPVGFRTGYGGDSWRVKKAKQIVTGEVSRVRSEVAFIDENDEPWIPPRRSQSFMIDFAIFGATDELIMQSKHTGPSNYLSTENDISVLIEIKHSKNGSGTDFYHEDRGAADILALSNYPGSVNERAYIFFDWWPEYHSGERRYGKYLDKVQSNISGMENVVHLYYIPRFGEPEHERLSI